MFCRSKDVAIIVFVLGLLGGSVELNAQSFTIRIDPVVIPYDPATGVGSATTQIHVSQDIVGGIPVVDTAGFSLGFTNDPSVFKVASLDLAGVLADLNGGAGPNLSTANVYPDGATGSAIYGNLGITLIPYPSPLLVFEITLETIPSAWIGNTVGGTATFATGSPVQSQPPVQTVMTYGPGQTQSPMAWLFPTLQFAPEDQLFTRGDADGDGSVIAVGDAITILGGLFANGDIPCEAAADVNGDGTLDIADPIALLSYGFGGGPPPPAPFPSCGLESVTTTLTCSQNGC